MTNQQLANTLQQILEVYRKIQEIKQTKLAPLEELLDGLKVKAETEMRNTGIKLVENEEGWIRWVDRNMAGKLDEQAIAKELGIENLDKFRKPGKTTHYLKVGINNK